MKILDEVAGYKLEHDLNYMSPHSFVCTVVDNPDLIVKGCFDNPIMLRKNANARFEREVIALEELAKSVHTPKLIESGDITSERITSEGIPIVYYTVLERLSGTPLFDGLPLRWGTLEGNSQMIIQDTRGNFLSRFNIGNLTINDYIKSALQLLELVAIVEDLNKQGIVHGDVKPANVISNGTTPKVIDFERSVVKGHEYKLESPGLGQPDYVIPNEHRVRATADISDDLFALGCMFHDLFPFSIVEGQSVGEFLAGCYLEVSEWDYDSRISYVHEYAKKARIDHGGFKSEVNRDPELAKALLVGYTKYLNSYYSTMGISIQSHNTLESRSLRHFSLELFQFDFHAPLIQALELEEVKTLQTIGRNLMKFAMSGMYPTCDAYKITDATKSGLEQHI